MSNETEVHPDSAVTSPNDAPQNSGRILPAAGLADQLPPTPIPAILDRHHVDQYHRQFLVEYRPVGPTEAALVADLARQAAASDRWAEAAGAVEREAARKFPEIVTSLTTEAGLAEDTLLAGTMATDIADRCERHALSRSRAFRRVLDKLEEVQGRRTLREQAGRHLAPTSFPDEASCEAYLAERFRHGKCPCSGCGATDGYYLQARRCWECARCHLQVGLRTGSAMAHSPIPLRRWFEAIRLLLWRPTITMAELSEKIAVRRLTTVRAMALRIREAMASEHASDLLVGLDAYFSGQQDIT